MTKYLRPFAFQASDGATRVVVCGIWTAWAPIRKVTELAAGKARHYSFVASSIHWSVGRPPVESSQQPNYRTSSPLIPRAV
jgi:hypothetical protein